ncbi:TetR family transcriptional regulator [Nocardia sp. CDC159]|uniref:TetR family transcriptional regulator n=1 Tax=Nocardia pulmonis TaxID=2951408 RepID=A0A9X2E3S8_9NOCA|nr:MULTISPECIES: TetR family transcriptional regulator [Nocardia]MCM6773120.1 TetR family transcriptional regulator [Nocardia pulmonis]MCM6785577.1 TetR family transcriptional regulator [Nocardia sp. CDC159]
MPTHRAPDPDARVRDAERTRRGLLEAAFDEFSTRGFAGARVGDIAARAGVNKQLITYYFGGKAGLYEALQRQWLDREAGFADPELPLDELTVRYLRQVLADPRGIRLAIWRALSDAAPTPPSTTADDLADAEKRRARGEIAADLDPAAVRLAIMGMVVAPVLLPDTARELFGTEPGTPEFERHYGEQLRRIVARFAHPKTEQGEDQ